VKTITVKLPPCYTIPSTFKHRNFSRQKGKHSIKIDVPIDVRKDLVSMKSILYCIACFFLYYSCEKIESLELPAPSIVGTWEEQEPDGITQFEGSTWESLKLNADNTFQITSNSWTDMMIVGDPCNGVDDYFIKGTYTTTPDSIFFQGCYSDSAFSSCDGKCDGQIDFMEGYRYVLMQGNLVINPEKDELIRRVLIPHGG
jgi:hypothetical protein